MTGNLDRVASASPQAISALCDMVEQVKYHLEPEAQRLEGLIATHLGVGAANVVVGNGMLQLIDLLFQAFRRPGASVVMSSPAFPFYSDFAANHDLRAIEVPLREYRHDVDGILSAVRDHPDLVVIDDPTSTTGQAFDEEDRVDFLKKLDRTGAVVVYDNAYGDYQANRLSASEFITKVSNGVYGATFSKAHQLFGLRVGYVVTNARLASRLRKLRSAYSVNILGLRAAEAALRDQEHFGRNVDLCKAGKEELYAALASHGIRHLRTETNFVLVDIGAAADGWAAELSGQHIPSMGPSVIDLPGHVWLLVRDPECAQRLIRCLPGAI